VAITRQLESEASDLESDSALGSVRYLKSRRNSSVRGHVVVNFASLVVRKG